MAGDGVGTDAFNGVRAGTEIGIAATAVCQLSSVKVGVQRKHHGDPPPKDGDRSETTISSNTNCWNCQQKLERIYILFWLEWQSSVRTVEQVDLELLQVDTDL